MNFFMQDTYTYIPETNTSLGIQLCSYYEFTVYGACNTIIIIIIIIIANRRYLTLEGNLNLDQKCNQVSHSSSCEKLLYLVWRHVAW